MCVNMLSIKDMRKLREMQVAIQKIKGKSPFDI